MNPLALIRAWLASQGVKQAPKTAQKVITPAADALDERILNDYTGHDLSQTLNRHLTGRTAPIQRYEDSYGVSFDEIIKRLKAMVEGSNEHAGPVYSGLRSPRYEKMLKESSELPVFLSSSPDLKTANNYMWDGMAVFKRPGKAINPEAYQKFSDEAGSELILPQGRTLKLLNETKVPDGKRELPIMLFEKKGGLVQMKERKNA
jgi:hypothetical protein